MKKAVQIMCYVLYHLIAKRLPASYSRVNLYSKVIRAYLARRMIKNAGKTINIEKCAIFSSNISIGDHSGIGVNCMVNSHTRIGHNVMMGPEVLIYTRNHRHNRTDLPMNRQGFTEIKEVIIGNDVWIGSRAIILPGVTIGDGVS